MQRLYYKSNRSEPTPTLAAVILTSQSPRVTKSNKMKNLPEFVLSIISVKNELKFTYTSVLKAFPGKSNTEY